MAAIDKLYAHNYRQYDDLLRWVMIYYPKMLVSFFDIHITSNDYYARLEEWTKGTREIFERDYKKLGNFETTEEAIENLRNHYKKYNYDMPQNQLEEEVDYIIEHYNLDEYEIEELYSFPIMRPTFKEDKILKWRCPLPFVRDYLKTHCGVKTRWYHKLFWKGEKLFN